jgi:hypothetical protein
MMTHQTSPKPANAADPRPAALGLGYDMNGVMPGVAVAPPPPEHVGVVYGVVVVGVVVGVVYGVVVVGVVVGVVYGAVVVVGIV